MEQSRSFEAMAAQTDGTMSYTRGSESGGAGTEPRSMRVAYVSAPYCDVFGTKAALGEARVDLGSRRAARSDPLSALRAD